jgi:mannose-6-phosphate isomerase-like protein (cupin superfamily)
VPAFDVDAVCGTLDAGSRTVHAMQHKTLRFGEGFRVVFDVRQVQAAEMVIAPGGSEGGPDNRHHGADQWLFVVAGTGVANVESRDGERRRVALKENTLLVIERGERHEVRNDGETLLKTLNFYYPPAFDADGDPAGPGKD